MTSKIHLPGVLLLLAAAVHGAAPDAPATLSQCRQWAEERGEGLRIRREDVLQSRARARAAFGGALPKISWEMTKTRQDPEGVETLEGRGFSGFVEKDQTESKFSLKQPLFSGFREFSAWSGFKREAARDALRLDRASRELTQRTAESFYDVLEREAEGNSTREALALADGRVKELNDFKRLGKARNSEVYTAQAHAAALKARFLSVRSRIASARETLSFLTGEDLSSRPLSDEIPSPVDAGRLADALTAAQGRSDLRAQREEVVGRRLRVRYERGAYWPGADVTANRYTRRPGFMDEIAWDVALSVHVPLFQGGSASARVGEASAAMRQSELTLEELERGVVHEVRRIHGELSSAVQEAAVLEEAAQAARKSHEALLSEYRLGLVTNLEVLQAMEFLLEQSTARDAAVFKAKRLAVQLNVSTEKMP